MKFLLALALLTSVAFANEAKKEEHKEAAKTEAVAEVKKEEHKEVAPTVKEDKKAAYKAAKEACLKENKDLKGKELKECIVSKNK
jgi:hypothetical protein